MFKTLVCAVVAIFVALLSSLAGAANCKPLLDILQTSKDIVSAQEEKIAIIEERLKRLELSEIRIREIASRAVSRRLQFLENLDKTRKHRTKQSANPSIFIGHMSDESIVKYSKISHYEPQWAPDYDPWNCAYVSESLERLNTIEEANSQHIQDLEEALRSLTADNEGYKDE